MSGAFGREKNHSPYASKKKKEKEAVSPQFPVRAHPQCPQTSHRVPSPEVPPLSIMPP
jgi:hypothetical protein